MPESRPPEEFPSADDPFVVVTTDPAGAIVTWNPGAETVCGWSAAEAIGRPLSIIFTDQDRAAGVPEREMTTALREGKALDERWHRREDGTTFWGSGVLSALRTADGGLLGFVKVFRDLTDRKADEEVLRESEERYRALFTSMTEGFALCEVVLGEGGRAVDYRVLEVNPAYERVTGLMHDQVVGRTAREIVPGPEIEGFIETYGRVVADRAPARFVSEIKWLGRWLDTYAFPVEPAGSGRFGVVVSDVTERRRDEEAIRASAEQAAFRTALADALRPLADPIEVQDVAARLLGDHLGVSRVHYSSFEPDGVHFVTHRGHVDGVASFAGPHVAEDFGVTLITAFRAGKTVVAPDERGATGTTEAERVALAAAEIRAFVGVPLVKDGRLAAVLAVHHARARAWTAAEIALVEEVAERTWAARERARAENDLRASEAQFRLMADAAPQAFWIADADGRNEFFNRWWSDYCGVPFEPATVADVAARFLHPDDAPAVVAAFAEARRTGRPFEVEQRNRSAAGDYRWFLNRAEPYRDPHTGEVIRWYGVGVDIHDRKLAEAALQRAADRDAFRARLADALRPLVDPTEVQGESARVLGEHVGASRVHYAEFEADGEHAVVARDYAHGVPNRAGRYRMADFALLHDEARAGRTFIVPDVPADPRLSAPEKAVFAALPVAAIAVVPLVKGGRLVAVMAVHHREPRAWTPEDVALVEETAERTWAALERAFAEASLRESEERYRGIFESIDEAYALCEMLVDDDGRPVDYRCLEVNPAHTRIVGPDDVVGKTGRELYPGLEEHWVETYARAGIGREHVRFENYTADIDRWYDVYASPVGGPDGRRFAIVFTDITERRRAEAEVRALNEALEGRVEARTREVRDLAARLTVAEQDERQRIAHVLHDDLQQQLYGLSAILSLLGRAPTGEAAGTLARQAVEIVGTATEMARSLATELSPTILQADRLVDVLEWIAGAERTKHDLEIEVEVRGDVRVADPAFRVLLYQILRELLFNVAKHVGGARVRLVGYTDGAYAVVRVEDDGAGFDVGSASEGAPGGFGLRSVRERLGLVGGRFELDSSPGRGTRVTLSVPSGAAAPGSP
ncbi:MAG TPA: PAS domain S-box protein [Rubricoccaceae bacterium]|jgi:PAS domain S-box-containing protein